MMQSPELGWNLPPSPNSTPRPWIVIGLGNPLLGDDGVGWRIVERVAQHYRASPDNLPQVDFECLSLGGLSLMERLVGYRKALVIDSIVTGKHPEGALLWFNLEDLPAFASTYTRSTHDTTLPEAIQIGKMMGAPLPESIIILAVEARRVYEFSEELSPAVAAAIPRAEKMILDLIAKEAAHDLA
ncbi:MAG: hydrogenase maturation protease [Anaerolineales bacterium]|nr:hydrogenase maturation protease [Anaerolineales bacterium]